MNEIKKAKYDKETGFPWDVVMNRADELFEMLHKEKFSSQDIAHIGLRLMLEGNFAWIHEGVKYAKETQIPDTTKINGLERRILELEKFMHDNR